MRRLVTCIVLAASAGLAAIPAAGAWSWPLQGSVLRPFALGSDPYAGGQHRGVDVEGAVGEDVRAPSGGTVTFAGTVPTSGRVVTILTTDGYAVTLSHLGELAIAKGAVVVEGDRVGEVGTSGTPEHAAPYVHLGVRVASLEHGYVDPLTLLPPRPVVTRSAPAVPQTPAIPQASAAQQAPAVPQGPAVEEASAVPQAAGTAPAAPAVTPRAPAPPSSAASTATGSGDPQQTASHPAQTPVPASAPAPVDPAAPLAPGGVTAPTTRVSTAVEYDPAQRRIAPASGAPVTSPRRPALVADAASRGGELHAGAVATPGVTAVTMHEPATRPQARPARGPAAPDARSRLTLPAGVLAADRRDGRARGAVGGDHPAAVATGNGEVRAARTAAAGPGATAAAGARHGSHVSVAGAGIEPPPAGAVPGLRAAPLAGRRGAQGPVHAVPSERALGDGGATAGAGAVAGDGSAAWLVGGGAAALLLVLVGLAVAAGRAATTPVPHRGGAWARA